MNKNIKFIVFFSIITISISCILLRENLNVKENVYVVSESNEKSVKTPKNTNEKEGELKSIESKNKEDELKSIESKNVNENNSNLITIFVSGEINKPGVVTLEKDKRLYDAVEKLGGFTVDANLNEINLAMKIEDEKHYIIPKIGEEVSIEMKNTDDKSNLENESKSESKNTNQININTADVKELEILPGIGEATANKIINYREEEGKFNAIEEIKNVNGIGEKKYENIKDMISIN